MTELLRNVPQLPRPADFIGKDGKFTLAGYSYLNELQRAVEGAVASVGASRVEAPTLSGLNSQDGLSYTLVLSDANKVVEMTSPSQNVVVVPPASQVPFRDGTQIILRQYGSGTTAILEGSGVTVRSVEGKLKFSKQYVEVVLTKRSENEWFATGALVA